MEVRLNVRNIDLRDAQEKVDDNLRQMRDTGRKAVLAYAGLWAMAYDEAVGVFEKSKQVFDQAEDRGEKLEAEANRRTQKMRDQAQNRLKSVESRVEKVRSRFSNRAEDAEESLEHDLERQVERVMERLGIPSRERITRLSAEIEALSQKIDAQLVAEPEVAVLVEGEMLVLPIPAYDTLTAREVIAMLDGMTVDELTTLKVYEERNQVRVTILREIERLLEAKIIVP